MISILNLHETRMKRLSRAKAAAQWIESLLSRAKAAAQWIVKKNDYSKFSVTSLPTGQAGNFSSLLT